MKDKILKIFSSSIKIKVIATESLSKSKDIEESKIIKVVSVDPIHKQIVPERFKVINVEKLNKEKEQEVQSTVKEETKQDVVESLGDTITPFGQDNEDFARLFSAVPVR